MRLFNNTYLKLALAGTVMLATAGVYSLSSTQTMTVEAVTSTAATRPVSQPDNPASNAGAGVTTKASKTASAPMCQRGNYAQPPAPAASASQPGLHQNVLAASHYSVYGNTVNEVTGQMAKCTPVGGGGESYAASTDYSLNWAFDYVGGEGSLCHVTAASVAINIAVVYPAWQPSSGASTGLNTSWQKFITNLTAHENGHIKIDQTGAAQLLASIQNFPPTDCSTMVAQVTAKANSDIQALNQANDNYDHATDHGTTQGAVLN